MSTTLNTSATASFLTALSENGRTAINRSGAKVIAKNLGLREPQWFIGVQTFKMGRGLFRIPTQSEVDNLGVGYTSGKSSKSSKSSAAASASSMPTVKMARPAKTVTVATPAATAETMQVLVHTDKANTDMQVEVSKALGVHVMIGSSDSVPYIPAISKSYVPWGHYEQLKTIVSSGHFLPAMIVGPSGNGKTEMCEQVCAILKKEYVRINITSQTDEDDLLGGFRLVNGETVFALGPVPLAMLRGAVTNIDEIDLGGAALMCLQPVLEGKPLYLKKIGRYIDPAPGFTVVATANTKGRGDDGKYAHTTIMNEAMLERFAVMYEQGWPDAAIERKIVGNILKMHDKHDALLVKHLVEFANVTRTNFDQQVCEDQIATRRLIHTARVFCALGNIDQAMVATLSRFEQNTAAAFRNLWNAIHEPVVTSPSGAATDATPVEPALDTTKVPF